MSHVSLDGQDAYFDSRDVLNVIEELEGERSSDLTDDDRKQLIELRRFVNEGEKNFEDWTYGVTFIREDEFEDYAKEYARDVGAVKDDAPWPLDHIDWEAAAEALAEDFEEITLHGTTYLGRP